jgi:hypothetical protein
MFYSTTNMLMIEATSILFLKMVNEKRGCCPPFTPDKSTMMTVPLKIWSNVEVSSVIFYSETTEKLISAIHHGVPWFLTLLHVHVRGRNAVGSKC